MADQDIAVQTLDANEGSAVTFTSAQAADNYLYVNSGKERVLVNNDSGGSIDLVFVTTKTVEGLPVPDRTITIPDGEIREIPPRAADVYNDGDSKVSMSPSANNLKIAVIKH